MKTGLIIDADDAASAAQAVLGLTILGWVPIANPRFPSLVWIEPATWFDKLAEFDELGWYLPFVGEA